MTMYHERIFDANGVKINFVQVSVSGRPVLLLHGTASEWQSFLPLIPALASKSKVYAVDLRGHGKSDWVSGKYRLSDYAGDIQCFLEQLVGQPAILYGHSLGAQIALAVAGRAPEYVHALILGDIPFYYHNRTIKETTWYEPFAELHYVTSSFHSAEELEAYMTRNYPNMDQQKRKARAETLSHVDPDVAAAILEDRHMEAYHTGAFLEQIRCQVLLIQGNPTLGAALRDEDLNYMVEHMQHCEVVHMQEIGHGLPAGESFSKVVSFLESDSSPGPANPT